MRWLLAVFLACSASAQTPGPNEKVIDTGNIAQCDLITRFPGDILNPNCLQQSTNLLSDRTGIPTRRMGYSLYNGTPCPGSAAIRGLWPFFADNGTQYLIMFSSQSMFYSPADGTCNVIPGLNGNLSATATMECVQSGAAALPAITGASLFCTDGIDTPFATNVSTVQFLTGNGGTAAPVGLHIGTFRNRILISGVPGAGSNGSGSSIFLSGELNGNDYTIPAIQLTTSPAQIQVNGINDGLPVNCLMGEFQNQFLVGRPYDLWGLSGYDLSDFALRKISSQVGCLEPRSVQEVTNVLYWLSYRGIEGYSGTQINRVSYPIDSQIIPIISAAGNSETFTLETQQQWESGNLTVSGSGAPMSTTIDPGSVVPASSTFVDGTTTTMVNVSTFAANTMISLSISTNNIVGGLFTNSGDWTVVPTFISNPKSLYGTSVANGSHIGTITCGYGHNYVTINCPFGESNCSYVTWQGIGSAPLPACYNNYFPPDIAIQNGTTGLILSQYNNLATGQNTFSFPVYSVASSTFVAFCLAGGGQSSEPGFLKNSITSGCNYFSGDEQGYSYNNPVIQEAVNTPSGVFNVLVDAYAYYDSLSGVSVITYGNVRVSSYSATGSYTSVFDTSFSTPVMGPVSISISSNSVSTLTLQQENSTDGILWSSPSALVNESQALGGERYWKYIENFATSNGTTTATAGGLSLEAETTGYYITPCVLVDSPTSYGNFLVNAETDDGALTFWTSTGATCSAVINPNTIWNQQVPNSIISVTTATTYLAERILFSVTSATEVPTLNEMTFSFTQGGGRPPTTSARWDDRYLLFYTTSTSAGAANDHVFIYDQNQKWQLWDDEYAASATLYQNTLYTGDSNATGTVYQQDIGQSDNSNPFTMTFQTADLDGGDPNMNKQFSRAYIILNAPSNNNGSASLSCNYAIDGSTSTYPLGSATLSDSSNINGYWVAKLPFPSSQPVTGHWVNMTCSYTGTVGPIAVHRVKLVYTNQSWD